MRTDIDDGGPAFPDPAPAEDGKPGMSLRDYFAGQAMAFWAGANIGGWCGDFPPNAAGGVARHCYILADAMLAARKARATP